MDKALDRAKIGVMLHGSVFISTIAFSMHHIWNDKIPTARTDGYCIEYNPEFFESLTHDERVFVIAHESWHTALMHIIRCGDRDKQYYNRAGDYVINQLLKDDRFTLPREEIIKVCQDDKYRDLSTNQVYDLIYKKGDAPDEGNMDINFDAPPQDDQDPT